jgi:hypothetical protein
MLMQWWFHTNMWCSFSSLWFGSGLGHGAGYNRWTTNPWWTQMSICDGSFHHYCPLLLLWPVHPWRMKKPICDGPFRSNKCMTRDTWRFSRSSSWVNCDAFSLIRDESKPSCIREFLVVFQVFQMFHTYVVSVLSEYCKTRSGCCMHFAMAFKCFQVFYNCFKCMLQVFQPLWTYVPSVSSWCCKSRSGVAYVTMRPLAATVCSSCWGIGNRMRHKRSPPASAWKPYEAWASSSLCVLLIGRATRTVLVVRPLCGRTACRHWKRGIGIGMSVERSLHVFGQVSGTCGSGGVGPRVDAPDVGAGNGVLAPASGHGRPSGRPGACNPLERKLKWKFEASTSSSLQIWQVCFLI